MPPYLKTGDTVGVLSTARKISVNAVQPAKTLLEARGFKVRLGQTIGAAYHQFAGDDQVRAADLQQMLDDPSVSAIMAAKGGYGTVRILDRLDFTSFRQQPKWLTGFSDVTVLHAHLNHCLGIPSIHGPMASLSATTPEQEGALVSLAQTLLGRPALLEVAAHPFNKHGTATGTVIGGNLSILYSLLESPESFQPAGKILFLEEVDEYLYHLDRMLSTFRRAGKLQGLAGLVIGTMTNMKDNEVPFGLTAEEMLYDHLSNLPVPVAFGFPAGHIAANQSFYLGMQAQLRVDEAGAKLSYEGDL